ncbi:MAG: GNAT family N-acetyltransferase [Eubacterium sp.]|nr:GNAT family N-acetyltransferase [Eubacterium sp.]
MNSKLFGCADSALETAVSIRYQVFCEEQGVALEEEIDRYDSDEKTRFVLIFRDGAPVATGRLIVTETGVKLGRIATLKAYRGTGAGAAVVAALCEEARRNGAPSVQLDAQLHAIPFYEKCGFHVAADAIIMDAGIAHKRMIKEL